MERWILKIDALFKEEPIHDIQESDYQQIQRALIGSSFHFSTMYRSYIPKPKKPGRTGKLRPITQPHKKDIILMDAISLILNEIFESLFIESAHGFRKGRGTQSFIAHALSHIPDRAYWNV